MEETIMAKTWSVSEAVKVIREGKNKADIIDITKRFPLFAVLAAANPMGIIEALPEYITARKIEAALKGVNDDEESENEDEEETVEKSVKEKPAKKSKKKPVPVEDDDEESESDDDEEEEKPAKKSTKKKPAPVEDDDDDDWEI
jgi:hypothetical protein